MHIQTQSEWEADMGVKILDYLKSEIYMDLRFMDASLSALMPHPMANLLTMGTDGISIYYDPEHLIETFKGNERVKGNERFLERAYIHTILHCIYAHLWMRQERVQEIWNLACDIAVEYIIDHMNKPCTKRILTWTRQQIYEEMEKNGIISAAQVYEWLAERLEEQGNQPDMSDFFKLQQEFFTDAHDFWPKDDKNQPQSPMQQEAKKKWEQRARQMQLQQERSGKNPKDGEQLLLAQITAQKSRRCYSDFLKKFAVLREEMHVDQDEFDLAYYTFGLNRYGDMPLIEPLESKEERKIQEFAIVLDTSYSTSGELVKNFLDETFSILMNHNAFFQTGKIHIIQCDEQVQSDMEITNADQMQNLIHNFVIQGGGNTDFRPAFTYVNQLIEERKFHNLGGLLYFTDGQGTYPKKRPAYKTAFLFLDDYDEEKIPAWAMKLRLDEKEFKGKSKLNESMK